MDSDNPAQDEQESGEPQAVATALQSPDDDTGEAKDDREQPERRDRKAEHRPLRWPRIWLPVIFSGVAALATAIYAWVSSAQLDVMRDALETSNRALLGVVEIQPFNLAGAEPCQVSAVVQNFGRVFAENISVAMELHAARVGGPDPGPHPDDFHLSRRIASVAPGAAVVIAVKCEPFEPGIIREVRSGQKDLYVMATIDYDDGFERRRTLCLCGIYNPEQGNWMFCERGNASDCR